VAREVQSKRGIQQPMALLSVGPEPQLAATVDALDGTLKLEHHARAARHDPTAGVFEVTHVVPADMIAAVTESDAVRIRSQQQPRDLDAAGREHEQLGTYLAPGAAAIDHLDGRNPVVARRLHQPHTAGAEHRPDVARRLDLVPI